MPVYEGGGTMQCLNLYKVQDSDRPMWVVAGNWRKALEAWKLYVGPENGVSPKDARDPEGISLICENDDLLLP